MDSTRISLARVLELGVPLTWREAAAIVYEAMARTGPTKGERPSHVASVDCELTRGGDLVLLDEAARARPETVLRLLEDLLPVCDSPGGLGAAFEAGRAIAFLEDLSLQVTAKRRRVEIAAVALRAISAEAAHQRTEANLRRADADRQRMEAERLPTTLTLAVADDVADALADFDEPIEIPPDLPLGLMPIDGPSWFGIEARLAEAEQRSSARVAPPRVHDHAPRAASGRAWNREGDLLTDPTHREGDVLTDPQPSSRAAAAAAAASSAFDELRATALHAAAAAPRLDLVVALRRAGRALRLPVLAAAVVATLGLGLWRLWPAPRSPRPDPSLPAAAAPPIAPAQSAAAAPAQTPLPEPARPAAAVQETRRDRTAAVRMRDSAPPVASAPPRVDPSVNAPVAAPPDAGSVAARAISPTVPTVAGRTISPPVPTPTTGIASPATESVPAAPPVTELPTPDDPLYSWATPEVQPPVLLSPATASSRRRPEGVIDGPYFEVLVAADGSVETVRIGGRIEPGETFYRHRMLLAAAKLWRFSPARVNGRPVRYVTRVVIDQP